MSIKVPKITELRYILVIDRSDDNHDVIKMKNVL